MNTKKLHKDRQNTSVGGRQITSVGARQNANDAGRQSTNVEVDRLLVSGVGRTLLVLTVNSASVFFI